MKRVPFCFHIPNYIYAIILMQNCWWFILVLSRSLFVSFLPSAHNSIRFFVRCVHSIRFSIFLRRNNGLTTYHRVYWNNNNKNNVILHSMLLDTCVETRETRETKAMNVLDADALAATTQCLKRCAYIWRCRSWWTYIMHHYALLLLSARLWHWKWNRNSFGRVVRQPSHDRFAPSASKWEDKKKMILQSLENKILYDFAAEQTIE